MSYMLFGHHDINPLPYREMDWWVKKWVNADMPTLMHFLFVCTPWYPMIVFFYFDRSLIVVMTTRRVTGDCVRARQRLTKIFTMVSYFSNIFPRSGSRSSSFQLRVYILIYCMDQVDNWSELGAIIEGVRTRPLSVLLYAVASLNNVVNEHYSRSGQV